MALVLVVPLLQGCYVYRSADVSEAPMGARVRARLAPAEAARLEAFTVEGTRALDGRVEEVVGDSVMMAVTVHSELQGNRIRNLEQRVQVERSSIIDLELRQLDRGRTAFLVGIGGAVVISAALLKARNTGTVNPGPQLPPDDAVWIPLIRFALPWF